MWQFNVTGADPDAEAAQAGQGQLQRGEAGGPRTPTASPTRVSSPAGTPSATTWRAPPSRRPSTASWSTPSRTPRSRKGYIGFRTHACCGERGTVYDAVVTGADGGTLLDTDFASGRNPFTGGEIVDSALVVSGTTDALYEPAIRPLPLLRKDFATKPGKKVASARVYASALGVYELEINGKPVGDQVLAPGWTNYHKRIQSQTYDVTKLLAPRRQRDRRIPGERLVGRQGRDRLDPPVRGHPRSRGEDAHRLHRRLRPVDRHGRFVEGGDGPYVKADLQDGETYDARLKPSGWSRPGFDDAKWEPAASRGVPDRPPGPAERRAGAPDPGAQGPQDDRAHPRGLRLRPRSEHGRRVPADPHRLHRPDRQDPLRGGAQQERHPLHRQLPQRQGHRPLRLRQVRERSPTSPRSPSTGSATSRSPG